MIRTSLLLVTGVALLAQASVAQPADDAPTGRTAAYSFVEPGEIPITVLVLGHVRSPGQYQVGIGTLPDRLLALAGGALAGPTDVETETRITVRLLRPDDNGVRRQVFERTFDDVIAAPSGSLDDGDVLDVRVVTILPDPPVRTLDTVLRVVSAAGTLFLIVYNVATR